MPLDAFCLMAVRGEISRHITGMKIEKIQQPERDVIILTLRGFNAPPCRLLISSGSGDARIHITSHRFENPASPPMFCMLLRKHLSGALIREVRQLPSERVLEFVMYAYDAIGDVYEKRLVVELIGRMANIILVGGDGIIIDCLRRIGGDLSDKRAVLPGLLYRNPAPQEEKADPLLVTPAEFRKLLAGSDLSNLPAMGRDGAGAFDKWLLRCFTGLSPLICRELSWRAYGSTDFRAEEATDAGAALEREFFALTGAVKAGAFEPWSLYEAGSRAPRDFSYIEIKQYENAVGLRRMAGFSEMLDGYYTRSAQAARLKQRAAGITRTVKTARDRLARKLAVQHEELKLTADRDYLRQCGDILMANLHIMSKGQREIITQDFYSPDGGKRVIALDPLKTPQQNAAKYYKEYTKAKSAEKFLSEQIVKGESELVYLESVLSEMEYAESESDIQEIRSELMLAGYVKTAQAAKQKQTRPAPMKFASSGGMPIYAGRNNMQNDMLTLKTASKTDIWLHAQKTHGSHVIISCNGSEPDEKTLYEAAAIAAYYSSARASGKAAVDYALVKHVRKPPGAKPGMVIYTNYKTIMAATDEEMPARLAVTVT